MVLGELFGGCLRVLWVFLGGLEWCLGGLPKYGVQMLAPLWRVGRVRLPGKQNTEARPHSMLLVNEVTRWNAEGTGARTDDCVMAQWFLEHNLEKLCIPTMINNRQWRPSWMSNDDEPALR